jgi:flagellar L-ring protein precursor FlgH
MRFNRIWLITQIAALALAATMSTGCSSIGKTLRNLVRGTEEKEPAKAAGIGARFSENENVRVGNDRQYKRMNRQKFEEEAELKADAGSLWVMEGQGAYLFSQNQIRMVGDLLNVKIEGAPKSQLHTKVRVISRLLERLDAPRALASQRNQPGQQPGAQPGAAPGQQAQQGQGQQAQGQNQQNPPQGQGAQAAGEKPEETAKKDEAPFAVEVVPTRIVEQLKDGSYRVRGMQPFMIGKREYKVIVTGIIRSEDFDDAGVEASRLLDPQFDIVSSKKGAM